MSHPAEDFSEVTIVLAMLKIDGCFLRRRERMLTTSRGWGAGSKGLQALTSAKPLA
ncbi:hypothetical protein [Phormidesmis sp. 146-12]